MWIRATGDKEKKIPPEPLENPKPRPEPDIVVLDDPPSPPLNAGVWTALSYPKLVDPEEVGQ